MSNSFPDGVSSSGQKKNRQTGLDWNPIGADAQSHRDVHGKSDVDSGPDALHHTLGRGAFQALPGSLIETIAPVGEVRMWFANTPPKGFIVLGGQTLNRIEYAELYNFAASNDLLGPTQTGRYGVKPFGTGDGSTTFTVPDMLYRLPLGTTLNAGRNEGMPRNPVYGNASRLNMLRLNHRHRYYRATEILSTSFAGEHSHGGNTGADGDHQHFFDTSIPSNITNIEEGSSGVFKSPGAQLHNHSGTTNSAIGGDHSHTISTESNHQHSLTIPENFEIMTEPSADSYDLSGFHPNSYLGDPTRSDLSFGIAEPALPHMEIIFIMRYTSLLDFEGNVQPDPTL